MDQPVGGATPLGEGLWIGGYRCAYAASVLRAQGITRILKLYSDDPPWPADFTVCNAPIDDGQAVSATVLKRGTSFIHEGIAVGEQVLVVCGLGVSRSATFVLAYLLEQGYSLPTAWQLLRERHPIARPHPVLWASLLNHYALPYTLSDVAKWW